MKCPSCHRDLESHSPSSLAGGFLQCPCGTLVDARARSAPLAPSPHRGTCGCGAPWPCIARACVACGDTLGGVRCGHCFTLHPLAATECRQCERPLTLEAELVPSDLPCPRCCHPLARLAIDEGTLSECAHCGGVFADHLTLHNVLDLRRPALNGWAELRTASTLPPALGSGGEVTYLPCPVCAQRMNRKLFGRRSGIIVDLCKLHGTWFDAEKLTAAVAVALLGLLEPKTVTGGVQSGAVGGRRVRT